MRIEISDDCDLRKIAESGQCFRWNEAEDGAWRVISGDRCIYIKHEGESCFDVSCDSTEFESYWHRYLDLDTSYRMIRGKVDRNRDPFLYESCMDEQGIRILRQNPFETLISFIISQNRNIPIIRRSIELLSSEAGTELVDTRGVTYYSFPEPWQIAAMSGEALGRCRLGYREPYVRRTAEGVLDGSIDLAKMTCADKSASDVSEAGTIKGLCQIYGVGPKVANCMSLFGLHHLDAFPIDVWVKRILADKYPDGYPIESYRPYNGVYQQYMFAHYRKLSKGQA